MLSIYPDKSVDLTSLGETLGLKRGAIVAISVGRLELKDGQEAAALPAPFVSLIKKKLERFSLHD